MLDLNWNKKFFFVGLLLSFLTSCSLLDSNIEKSKTKKLSPTHFLNGSKKTFKGGMVEPLQHGLSKIHPAEESVGESGLQEGVVKEEGLKEETTDEYKKIVDSIFTREKGDLANLEGQGQIMGSATLDPQKSSLRKSYFLYGAEHLNLKNYYFDIPVVYNDQVKKWINFFLTKGRPFFIRYGERAGRYAPVLGKILESYGLPRDLIFLAMAESGFQNKAKSRAKAVGPWQFMPYTGRRYGLDINWFIDERRDPIKSSIAASKFLKKLFSHFGSWELAAAGYNAGEGKIERAIERYRTWNFWEISKGSYLKPETKNYVPKIMALAIVGKNLDVFNLNNINFGPPLDFEEIVLGPNSDLIELSECLNIPFDKVQYFNPELLRWQTPPQDPYPLRVPVGFKDQWKNVCEHKNFTAHKYQIHILTEGQNNLSEVAEQYGLQSSILAQLNQVSPYRKLPKSFRVKLPFRLGQSLKDEMYADIHSISRGRSKFGHAYTKKLDLEVGKIEKIAKTREYYIVQKGDTLWHVSKKTGVPIDTIIQSNLDLVSVRMIREGDKLIVR